MTGRDDFPNPFGFAESLEEHFTSWFKRESFACCELTDTVSNNDSPASPRSPTRLA